jgi:hypothetical protein
MKITPSTSSDEVKEVINVMKNYRVLSTGHLRAEGFRYGGNDFRNGTKEIVTKLCEGEKGPRDGRKVLTVRCVGKERKWIVQILWGWNYILVLTEHFP